MVPKAKKEAPAPPKVKAKAKALKTKKTVLKGVHSHKNIKRRSTRHPPFGGLTHCGSKGSLNILGRAPRFAIMPSTSSPNYQVSHERR